MGYAIYLRKSRADMEAEARGEGETLARHRSQLLELARRQNLNITQIYEEIVSGESIAARPQMQQLLSAVNEGIFEGVLVMEIERLARGDTMDQGIVSQAFKFSGTKIITPTKTYDPANEFDEEYFEFNLFMSRREYKTIRRRMQAGRMASVREGNYIGSLPPYGYKKIRNYEDKAYTLEPIPEEAETVRLMYELYTTKEMGFSKIATYLNKAGIPPKVVDTWNTSSVKDIIQNPIYSGYLRWDWRKTQKKLVDGKVVTSRPKSEGTIYKGKHPAIISEETWQAAKAIWEAGEHLNISFDRPLQNCFAGLMYCELCGHSMVRRPYAGERAAHYYCGHKGCACMSASETEINELVLSSLRSQLQKVREIIASGEKYNPDESDSKTGAKLSAEIEKLKKQKEKLYDLLEQGIYTTKVFLERSENIESRISELNRMIAEIPDRPKNTPEEAAIALEYAINRYDVVETAAEKRDMLKTVIKRIDYIKTTGGRWKPSDLALKITFNV